MPELIIKRCYKAGTCPYCESENITYGSVRLTDNSLGYDFHCEECGQDSIEWYNLNYDYTEGD